jgi:thiosulfate reductase cytochrome b subunit
MSNSYGTGDTIHPLVVRITHWINAVAMICMIASGWKIYNASPLFGFAFPNWMTLGGWLGGAIGWHLGALWVLVSNGLVYVAYGLISGHFRRNFLPLSPREILEQVRLALTFQLHHQLGVYNAVQRLLYVGVLTAGVGAVVSGLAIWKPVQFQEIAALLGGYEGARLVHFVMMSGIVAFIIVHLALVAIVPKTLPPMITGHAVAEKHS